MPKKRYLALIVLIALAAILNILVLGMLGSQDNGSVTDVTNPIPKVLVSIIPSVATDGTNVSLSPSTDKLTITNIKVNGSAGSFLVSVFNNGSSDIAITSIYVNDYTVTPEKGIAIPANSSIKLLLTLTDGIIFGNTYQIRLLSSEGYSAAIYGIID